MVEVRAAYSKDAIEELLDLGGEIDIAVAYIDDYGMKLIQKKVQANTQAIKKVRLLVDLKGGVTHPDAVKSMVELSEAESDRFECKEYYTEEHPHAGLHAKLLISNSGDSVTFLTGSCNLTKNAIEQNKEHGVRVQCPAGESLAKDALDYFRELWDSSCARVITRARCSEYEEFYKRVQEVERRKGTLRPPVSYWLFKCNVKRPFTFDDLQGAIDWWSTASWEAAGHMEKIKIGDGVLFYHSGIRHPQVMGTAEVVTEPYDGPDGNPSKPDKRVDIQAVEKFPHPVTLQEIKANQELGNMQMLRTPRVAIQPVTPKEWNEITRMGMEK